MELHTLPSGEVARIEEFAGQQWFVYFWGSREDYDADMADPAQTWDRCTVSVSGLTSREDALAEVQGR